MSAPRRCEHCDKYICEPDCAGDLENGPANQETARLRAELKKIRAYFLRQDKEIWAHYKAATE